MSRDVVVQTIQPDPEGPIFGQGSDPLDLMKAQDFGHEHTESLVRDFFVRGADRPLVAGFAALPLGGMSLRIDEGHVVDAQGRSYETYAADEVEIELLPAHSTLTRIDFICALLEVDAAAELELRPFTRLRTQLELEEEPPVTPYAPAQFEVPTERHTRATVIVRSGVPAENPAVPQHASDEVPLYQIVIEPGLTEIREDAIIAVHLQFPSLLQLLASFTTLSTQFNQSLANPRRYTAGEIGVGAGAGTYEGKSVQEFINDQVHGRFLSTLILPETLTPEKARNDAAVGQLSAVGDVDSGPVVDIPADRNIVFRSGSQSLTPSRFPSAVNARVVSKAVDAGTQTKSNTVNFSLGGIAEIASDGGGKMIQAVSPLPQARKRPALCGRGDRYIEIFSGFTASETPLIDWHTYDVLADTLTAKNFSVPPASPRQYLFAASCGINSDSVLLAMGQEGPANWYKLNAVTGVLTALVGGPAGGRFVGDLIAPDLLFFISTEGHGVARVHRYWKFVPSTNTFTELTPTGTLPTYQTESFMAGYFDQGKCIVLVGRNQGTPAVAIDTFIYDSAANQFTQLSISGPYSDRGEFGSGETFQLQGAAILSAEGRSIFFGSNITRGIPLLYEISPGSNSSWKPMPATGAVYRNYPGGGTVRTTTMSGAYAAIAGGMDTSGSPTAQIFKIEAGGLIETQLGGQPALTLSGNATFSIFRVPDLLVGFVSGNVIANLAGSFPAGSIKIEYSVDDGVSWTAVAPGVKTTLAGPSPYRQLRITLFRSGTANPILQTLNEILHQAGGSSFGLTQLALRFDVTDQVNPKWLYLDEVGNVTVEAAGLPSTAMKAVLLKITPNGAAAPTVKNYINRRYAHLLRRATRAAGATPPIDWDFAVMPQLLKATKVLADGTLKELLDATAFPNPLVFDTDIVVGGITVDGDGYRVDIEL